MTTEQVEALADWFSSVGFTTIVNESQTKVDAINTKTILDRTALLFVPYSIMECVFRVRVREAGGGVRISVYHDVLVVVPLLIFLVFALSIWAVLHGSSYTRVKAICLIGAMLLLGSLSTALRVSTLYNTSVGLILTSN